MSITKKKILPIIKTALKEDIGSGDITSKLIIPPKREIKAVIMAKQAGLVCGLDVAKMVFQAVNRKVRFRATIADGKKVKKGKVLARLQGDARSILKAERVALNFLARLSGIATLTDKYIQKVKSYPVKIMDTRKTTPGLRILEKYAVGCVGGSNHRLGLWDQVLVKENHWFVVRSSSFVNRKKILKETIEKIRKRRPKGIRLEVEVRNLSEFKQVLEAKPDIIMLDNFSIRGIRKAVQLRNQKPEYRNQKLEVSGGVDLQNVAKIAATGVERISVGELTHSPKALDLSLNCE